MDNNSNQNNAAYLVKDINPGSEDSDPRYFEKVNNTFFFSADDGKNGHELWKSDGTPDGTELVKDIVPGSEGSLPADLTNVNGTLFVSANDDSYTNNELWKSDGTTNGTELVKDIGDIFYELTDVNGNLFFISGNGYELLKSDGTQSGTVLVKNFPQDKVFYNTDGTQLWKNDGNGNRTQVSDINFNGIYNLTYKDGIAYFSTLIPGQDRAAAELWKSDGTQAGTVKLATFSETFADYPVSSGTLFANISSIGNIYKDTVYFAVNTGAKGAQLWKTDGTANGTVLVKDMEPGVQLVNSAIKEVTNIDGSVFFEFRGEVWKSDGTDSGTQKVDGLTDIPPELYITEEITNLVDVNGTLYFTVKGNELWKSDGIEAGTSLVKTLPSVTSQQLTNLNGDIYFFTQDIIDESGSLSLFCHFCERIKSG